MIYFILLSFFLSPHTPRRRVFKQSVVTTLLLDQTDERDCPITLFEKSIVRTQNTIQLLRLWGCVDLPQPGNLDSVNFFSLILRRQVWKSEPHRDPAKPESARTDAPQNAKREIGAEFAGTF